MRLVLTYHRIVERAEAAEGFFDVTADVLEHHIRLARQVWGQGMSPIALIDTPRRHISERQGFLVTFDDGTIDHAVIAAPLLEKHGVRGVFFVNTHTLGTPGYMTLEQCRELQSKGHAIESHSHDHLALTELSDVDLRWQLTESRRRLRDAGMGLHDFIAAPGGFFDARVMNAAAASGYRLLRTLEWGYNTTLNPMRVASITMNQQTAGRICRFLMSPHGEAAKKTLYQLKEATKVGRPSLYFRLRSFRGTA